MDPLTAIATMITALAEMVTEIARGQPPEVRKQIWDWYIEDQKILRKLFKLE